MNIFGKKIITIAALCAAIVVSGGSASAQSFMQDIRRDAARSDKRTGGTIEKTRLVPGEGDIKITINVPSFQMTLWQNGKEVKTYWVGVGMKEFPIFIGLRRASDVIWNPDWIPPSSDWVLESKTVKPGEVIKPTDPRNPIGKLKIPLGLGYLIHQAKGAGDLGSLVSHGCVRVMKTDLLDLADKIVAARSLPVTPAQIRQAKLTKKTLSVPLEDPIPVEITYDTQVVEGGSLHLYPDIYEYKTLNVKNVREELESNGVETERLSNKDLERIIARATGKKKFVVSLEMVRAGKETSGGRVLPVVNLAASNSPARRATR